MSRPIAAQRIADRSSDGVVGSCAAAPSDNGSPSTSTSAAATPLATAAAKSGVSELAVTIRAPP